MPQPLLRDAAPSQIQPATGRVSPIPLLSHRQRRRDAGSIPAASIRWTFEGLAVKPRGRFLTRPILAAPRTWRPRAARRLRDLINERQELERWLCHALNRFLRASTARAQGNRENYDCDDRACTDSPLA